MFAFGDAPFLGSATNLHPAAPVVGIATIPSGRWYYVAAVDGGVFAFGDALFFGSPVGFLGWAGFGWGVVSGPIVGIAASPYEPGTGEVEGFGGF